MSRNVSQFEPHAAPPAGSRAVTRFVVASLLTIHAGLLAWQAYRYSPTMDEPAHMGAGISHWKFGRFDLYRVNPPLVRMVAALPMLVVDPKVDWSAFSEAPYARPEFAIGSKLANGNGFDIFWDFTLARWACIPFSLVGGYFCYRWGRELYGVRSGIVALVLWCFCPNILGNGALITPDVPAAALGVTACYFFWRWLKAPGWSAAFLAGLTLGLAELTKATWIILFPLYPAMWLVWSLCQGKSLARGRGQACIGESVDDHPIDAPRSTPTNPQSAIQNPKCVAQLAAILLLALYLLNLGYGFEKSFQPLGKFAFISRTLGGPAAHEKPGNRFAGTWLASVPVPVPANYLRGIDVQKYDFEKGKWSYLRGEQKFGGWWYYYLYAMAVKMPVGTLALIGIACVFPLTGLRREPTGQSCECAAALQPAIQNPKSASILLLLPALAVLVLISFQTGFSRYLRYALPAFPFLFLFASGLVGATPKPRKGARSLRIRGAFARAAIPLLLLVSATSSLAVFPHSLSYFNEVAGGPLNGADHLLDANIDWGQDLLEFKRWHDGHPGRAPQHAFLFGFVSPATAGIDVVPLPPGEMNRFGASDGRADPSSGWCAISVNELYGYKHFGDRADNFSRFRHFSRMERCGYSIRLFSSVQHNNDSRRNDRL